MSEIAEIIKAVADDLDVVPAEKERVRLYTILDVLKGLPDYYHKEAVMAGLGLIKLDKEKEDE